MKKKSASQHLDQLLDLYPSAKLINTSQSLSEIDFQSQKEKQFSNQTHAGSIGILYTPTNEIVLVNRSNLHAGWALPGGSLEHNENFSDAFRREIEEETALVPKKIQLIILEKKLFISPKNETLDFLLAVFSAPVPKYTLASPTAEALSEGLTVAFFNIDKLPSKMILNDRSKIEYFSNNLLRDKHDL